MQLLKKVYILSSIKKVYFCKINNTQVLVLYKNLSNESQYILIPQNISYSKKGNYIEFSTNIKFLNVFNTFINSFSYRLKCFEKSIRKKIILTGLGFKVGFSKDLNHLEFKLGLSHIVTLEIPKNELTVFLFKNTVVVEGLNPVSVGNFLKKIKNFKMPGSYTGKGFWYKNEIKILKPVKKT